ncbi:MAG: 5'/3'-nucleotidase SurE [Planctomycetia bacterium]|nr:5'/3'-nucleotidase SurE [Planctomycetia bacterium]
MQILLTNDDGIFSPGLAAMASALQKLGNVCIAAPATEQSGVGQSITFLNPVTVKRLIREEKFWGYAVTGSPVDCVKLGIDKLSPVRPDLVVSGINNGLNTGANIIYSGTIAATLEASYQGITSVAVSTQMIRDGNTNLFESAAELALALIRKLLDRPESKGELFNINIPRVALEYKNDPKIVVTGMDTGVYWDRYEERTDPAGRVYYWLAGRPSFKDIQGEHDMGLVSQGAVTITPLDFNPTKRTLLKAMTTWDFSGPAAADAASDSERTTQPDEANCENKTFLNFRMVQG